MRWASCLLVLAVLAGCDASISSSSHEGKTYTISVQNTAANDAPDGPEKPPLPVLKPNQFGGNGKMFDVLDGAARVNEPGRVTVAFTSFKIDGDELRRDVTHSAGTVTATAMAVRTTPAPFVAFTFILADADKGLTLGNVKSWFCVFYLFQGKVYGYEDAPGEPAKLSLTRLEGSLKEGGTVSLSARLPVTKPDGDDDYYYFSIDRMVGVFAPSED